MPTRLLLLPGYACTADIWQPLAAALGSRVEAVLLDWPQAELRNFSQLTDFSGWLRRTQPLDSFNAVVGHSLGGLVGALALAEAGLEHVKLILVESFLTPPGPFFQNLTMADAPAALRVRVQSMLVEQRPAYAPDLPPALRDIQLGEFILDSNLNVFAIYGDRGCGDRAQVIRALGWPQALQRRVPVEIVPNGCHFLMLEQPQATAAAVSAFMVNKSKR